MSHFGGPAWTLDPVSEQYYCHLFLPEQPDLNWANPAVRDAFDGILRFWCDRGADGFRIDVAHSLLKSTDFADNALLRPIEPDFGPAAVFDSFDHAHDLDQDDNLEIYRRWRRLTEPYDVMLVGEVNVASPLRSARYTAPGVLDTVFYLKPAWAEWDPEYLLAMLTTMHDADADGVSWTMNSHDTSRSVSRFGGGEAGRRRSLAVTTLEFALGGVPFLYQGEELGLDDATLAPGDRADPIWTRNPGNEVGRDGSRSAMPWTDGPANGFTTGTPWLHAAERPVEQSVRHQRATPGTILHTYRELIAVRAAHADLHRGALEWIPVDRADAVAGRRGGLVFVANLGTEPLVVDLGEPHTTVFSSWSALLSSSSSVSSSLSSDAIDDNASTVTVPPETSIYCVTAS